MGILDKFKDLKAAYDTVRSAGRGSRNSVGSRRLAVAAADQAAGRSS